MRLCLAKIIGKRTHMNTQEIVSRCSAAAEEFDRKEHRGDGLQVIESVCGGLTLIRDTFFARVHKDVEIRVGMDSMVSPISEEKTEHTTKEEIEIYQVVVSAAAAEAQAYVTDGGWYRDWLAQLRLGTFDAESRIAGGSLITPASRPTTSGWPSVTFWRRFCPSRAGAPLILLRLLPPAVQIATALAFGKSADALRWRHEQVEILPAIADCHRCHGKLLENGEQCQMCGNPLWTFGWMTSADE